MPTKSVLEEENRVLRRAVEGIVASMSVTLDPSNHTYEQKRRIQEGVDYSLALARRTLSDIDNGKIEEKVQEKERIRADLDKKAAEKEKE